MCAKAKAGVSIKGTPSSFILKNVGSMVRDILAPLGYKPYH